MLKYQTRFVEKSIVNVTNNIGKSHVAVIGGGMSAEREVSLISMQAAERSLIELGYQVTTIDMGADIANILSSIKPNIVFNCLHGTYGEDGCLPGLLNIMRIPYTHSGVLASAIAFDKIKSREILNNYDIPVPFSIVIEKKDKIKNDPMRRPYVIKPLNQGSSIGVEVIFEEDDFSFANYDFPYGDKIIIEEYIKGKELQTAILNGKAYGTLEIKLLQRRFYDYDTKYTSGLAEHILPANIPEDVNKKLLQLSTTAYNAIGCNGLVRAEFIYTEGGQIFMLELNTHPGMTPLSICQEILGFYNITFNQIIESLLSTARYDS